MIHNHNFEQPASILEAITKLGEMSEKAVEAGKIGDENSVRLYVDATRPLKAFIRNHKATKSRNVLIDQLGDNPTKKIMVAEALQTFKSCEHFISSWQNRYLSLNIPLELMLSEEFSDMYIDSALPSTWDFSRDIFVVINQKESLIDKLIDRGQKRFIIFEKDKELCEEIKDFYRNRNRGKADYDLFVVNELKHIPIIIQHQYSSLPPMAGRVMNHHPSEDDKDANLMKVDLHDVIMTGITQALAYNNTVGKWSLSWVKNTITNLAEISKSYYIEKLYNKFSDVPALLVCPGPSLDKNIHLISEMKGRSLIIATSHAVSALHNSNIIPDIILHIDPSSYGNEYLEGLDLSQSEMLMLAATVDPFFFNLKVKSKSWLMGQASADDWIAELFPFAKNAPALGASVSTAGFLLAKLFGCPKIILVGTDLAGSMKDGEDHQEWYANGSKDDENTSKYAKLGYYDDIASMYKKDNPFIVKGWGGGKAYSKFDFKMYLEMFEGIAYSLKDEIKSKKLEIYNCTEGGAFIKGFKHVPLKNVIKKLPNFDDKDYVKNIFTKINEENNEVDSKKLKRKMNTLLIKANKLNILLDSCIKYSDKKNRSKYDGKVLNKKQKKITKLLHDTFFIKLGMLASLEKAYETDVFMNTIDGQIDKANHMYSEALKISRSLTKELQKTLRKL